MSPEERIGQALGMFIVLTGKALIVAAAAKYLFFH